MHALSLYLAKVCTDAIIDKFWQNVYPWKIMKHHVFSYFVVTMKTNVVFSKFVGRFLMVCNGPFWFSAKRTITLFSFTCTYYAAYIYVVFFTTCIKRFGGSHFIPSQNKNSLSLAQHLRECAVSSQDACWLRLLVKEKVRYYSQPKLKQRDISYDQIIRLYALLRRGKL